MTRSARPSSICRNICTRSRARVLGALLAGVARGGFWRALLRFGRDLPRDFSRNRFRRFGQALVLAAEWPRMPAGCTPISSIRRPRRRVMPA